MERRRAAAEKLPRRQTSTKTERYSANLTFSICAFCAQLFLPGNPLIGRGRSSIFRNNNARKEYQVSDVILDDKILSSSAYSHVIAVPQAKIDIADWLFNLAEAEYQRCCPPDHISCGSTFTDDGTRMSINVEMIGQTLAPLSD
jgi:hypothetical protein